MNTFKRAKCVLLHTDKASNYSAYFLNKLELHESELLLNKKIQHLYILSDEEIKEGDWFIGETNIPKKCKKVGKTNAQLHTEDGFAYFRNKSKKIIATTDSSIYIDNNNGFDGGGHSVFPKPSQSFIEKYIESYNNSNSIVDVMVEYMRGVTIVEEKQWENNQLFLKLNPKDNTITIKKVKDSYTKDELKPIFKLIQDTIHGNGTNSGMRDCLDGYYSKCFNEQISKIDKWIQDNL